MAGDALTVSPFTCLPAAVSDLPTCDGLGHLLVIVCCSFMSLVPKEPASGSRDPVGSSGLSLECVT